MESFYIDNIHVHVRRRAFKRSVSLLVKANGDVVMTAGRLTPLKHLHSVAVQHQRWINKHLQKVQLLNSRFPPKKFISGEKFLFFGVYKTLQVEILQSINKIQVQVVDNKIIVKTPTQLSSEEVKDILLSYFHDEGKVFLTVRLEYWSNKMEVKPKRVSFRSQTTRWGSCSPTGHISLNWRLICAPLEVIDYVIIHELGHLKHMNHSQNFWRFVQMFSPHYLLHRKWLSEHHREFDFSL